MSRPTPQQIEEARSAAVAKFAARPVPERVSRLVLLPGVTPTGRAFSLLAVPFTFAGYAAHHDRRAEDIETAQASLYAERVVWPPNALDLAREAPGLVVKVDEKLHEIAGAKQGLGTWAPLDPASPPPKLSAEDAAHLAHTRPLWAYQHAKLGISLVFEAPDADVYHAVRARTREAAGEQKGIVESFIQPLRDSVRWSSEPIDVLLDRLPHVVTFLLDAWSAAGGADVELKSELV